MADESKAPPMGRSDKILAGLRKQNEPAEFEGQQGYWCQADCVFIHARHPTQAIDQYRRDLAGAMIGISHNLFCGDIRAAEANRDLVAVRDILDGDRAYPDAVSAAQAAVALVQTLLRERDRLRALLDGQKAEG